jgi:hypothetical protein
LAAALVSGSVARADEMDRDTKGKAAAVATATTTNGGSELDRESPDQSHFWRRGYGVSFYGGGWGGGYGGYSVSYRNGFGLGIYRPLGWGYRFGYGYAPVSYYHGGCW